MFRNRRPRDDVPPPEYARAADEYAPTAIVPSTTPLCSSDNERCELFVPSGAFGEASEREKRLAAKMFGLERGEEGWYYANTERAETPGYIVVRRRYASNI